MTDPSPSSVSVSSTSADDFNLHGTSTQLPPTTQRASLTGIGLEAEAILLGVLAFVAGGVIMFFICMVVNKIYICYKMHQIRKKRKREGLDDDDDDFTEAVISGNIEFDDDIP